MGGPIDHLRRLAGSGASLLLTRAKFASLELAEARAEVGRWLGLALVACALAVVGLASLVAAAVLALWPLAGWLTLLPLAALLCGVAGWLVARVRREMREAPPLLAQTLEELARDRDALLPSEAQEREPAPPAAAG
ncbi:MAG: phage holin family protein [Rubrivivax sp.]|nr:phage holin family protein [Rubrivivax sp.]